MEWYIIMIYLYLKFLYKSLKQWKVTLEFKLIPYIHKELPAYNSLLGHSFLVYNLPQKSIKLTNQPEAPVQNTCKWGKEVSAASSFC